MGEVINLNKARKAADKAKKVEKAADNRAKSGLSKFMTSLAEKQREIDARRLDSSRLDKPKKD